METSRHHWRQPQLSVGTEIIGVRVCIHLISKVGFIQFSSSTGPGELAQRVGRLAVGPAVVVDDEDDDDDFFVFRKESVYVTLQF